MFFSNFERLGTFLSTPTVVQFVMVSLKEDLVAFSLVFPILSELFGLKAKVTHRVNYFLTIIFFVI